MHTSAGNLVTIKECRKHSIKIFLILSEITSNKYLNCDVEIVTQEVILYIPGLKALPCFLAGADFLGP